MASRPNALVRSRGVPDTILVAEDAPEVRLLMTESLVRQGHVVLGAVNGVEALAVAAALPRLDLLVTDLSMPGLDGFTLAVRLRVARPLLPVLFVSGAPDGILPERLPQRTSFLPKPFGVAAFVSAAQRAIAAGRTGLDDHAESAAAAETAPSPWRGV